MITAITFVSSRVTYYFPQFFVVFDAEANTTRTWFYDGHWTGGTVVEDDKTHADILGLTPALHRLQHELAHSFIGLTYYGALYSPVLWHAAHADTVPLPADYQQEEWLVTALQYYSENKLYASPKDRQDREAINVMRRKGIEVSSLGELLHSLIVLATSNAVRDLRVTTA